MDDWGRSEGEKNGRNDGKIAVMNGDNYGKVVINAIIMVGWSMENNG